MNCPTALASSEAVARRITQHLDTHLKHGSAQKPLLTNWLGDGAAEPGRRLFAAARPTFETPSDAVRGFMQLVRHARAQKIPEEHQKIIDQQRKNAPSLEDDDWGREKKK